MAQETKVKATFPSLEWLQALREIINPDDGYKRIGTCDAVVGLKVPDRQKFFLLPFEAFEVLDVKEVSEREAEDSDFWLELTLDRWQELLQNIKTNGKADLHHTLNTIDLEDPEGFARSRDGSRRYGFSRVAQRRREWRALAAPVLRPPPPCACSRGGPLPPFKFGKREPRHAPAPG